MFHRLILSGVLVFAVGGCQVILGIDDPQRGTPDDLPDASVEADASNPAFTANLLTPKPSIPVDGQNILEIEIVRVGGFDGDVDVTLMGAPNGISADALTIAGGQDVGELVIGAVAPHAIGDTVTFQIFAQESAGSLQDTIELGDIPIVGAPGSVDSDFSGTGIFTASFGSDDGGRFKDCIVGSDGAITAIGFGDGGLGGNRQAAIRLLPNGNADSTFSGGTLQRNDFGTGSSAESARAVSGGHQVDGKFISIGTHSSTSSFPKDIGLMRYNVNGNISNDLAFGNHANGQSRVDVGGAEEIRDGLVLSSGKIIAVGQTDTVAVLARASQIGEFEGAQAALGGVASILHSVVLDGQGRLVVSGSANAGAVPGIVVGRFTADDLEPDTSFGNGGLVVEPEATNSASGREVAVYPDGRIVVASTTASGGPTGFDLELKRYNVDGTPDTTFGTDGAVLIDAGGNDRPEGLVVQPDGRILVLVNILNGDQKLLRFRADGAVDNTFDNDGSVVLFLGDVPDAQSLTLSSQDNRVIVCGGNLGGVPGPGTFGIVTQIWF